MLLEKLLTEKTDNVHILSLMREPHDILLNSEDALIIHTLQSDIFIAECQDEAAPKLAECLSEFSPQLIETTNEKLFEIMHSSYANSYRCFQYALPMEGVPDSSLQILSADDLPVVINTYHDEKYLRQLFERSQILGYYPEGHMAGYALRHIDGTLGALYIAPEYRKMGYGRKLTLAAIAHFNDPLLYSQVIDDNTASIRLHQSICAIQSSRKICWMFNHGFSY